MYKDMNDYEIIYMVCDNDEDSFDLLLHKYQPLIYKIVKDYIKFFKQFGYELDDLMQLGYITLYKTSRHYNTNNQSMFFTYYKKALMNTIIENIRVNSTTKREILNKALSYDILIPNTNIRYIDLFPSNNKSNDIESELIIFKNSMPINLSNIFELLYNGYTKEEISILLDEDINDIKNNYYKIKEHALTYKHLFFA